MNLHRNCALAPALLCLFAVISCGTTRSPISYTSLDGNWTLTGNSATGQYPAISAVILANGNQINASLTNTIQCSPGTSIGGSGMVLTGQIQADGSFTMTNPAAKTIPGSSQFTITGRQPTWAAQYGVELIPS